jgi:hypothetical protein
MNSLVDQVGDHFLAFIEARLQQTIMFKATVKEIQQVCHVTNEVSGKSLCKALQATYKAKGIEHFVFSYDPSKREFFFRRILVPSPCRQY